MGAGRAAKIVTAIILCLIITFKVCSSFSESDCFVTSIPVGEYLRVHSSGSIRSAEIGKLWLGDVVSIESYADGWALVGGVPNEPGGGYVMVGYLSDALTDPVECKTTAFVRVRDLPDGKTIRKLRKGKPVTVLGVLTIEGISWANTGDGWIMNKFLEGQPDVKQ